MKIDILTLFPEFFEKFLDTSIIKRAISKAAVEVEVHNIRDFTLDKNGRVDDYPLGGGAGLIMKCQPVLDCLKSIRKIDSFVALTSPRGTTWNQKKAIEYSKLDHLILVCGHYEGIDERVNKHVDELVSIGDYILTGGEVAALTICDSIIRLLDGAITNESLDIESFDDDLLEYPQYTFPRDYNGDVVPDVLLCGNHKVVGKWRKKEQLKLTKKYRPDLFDKHNFTKEELKLLQEIEEGNESPKWLEDALEKGKKFLDKK